MKSSTYGSLRFVHRLGMHHFAHLRATAEGLDVVLSAKRYLGVDNGHEARAAHLQTVEVIRAIARRRGESAWRLIGVAVSARKEDGRPNLEEFIQARGLDGWSEAEVADFYEEAYPPDPRGARRKRLHQRQLELIKRLEGVAAEAPQPTDLVSGWFDDISAGRIMTAGMLTLGDLAARIAIGGRWYTTLPSIGRSKASRIETHLIRLLPTTVLDSKPVFALSTTPTLFEPAITPPNTLTFAHHGLFQASNDLEAVDGWIAARAGSMATARAYRREAHRLLLWLRYERQGKLFSGMTVNDCGDYMAFLQHIPTRWISRVRAAPGQPGWAPFRGPLSHQSRRQAIVIIAAMFRWLQAAQYIQADPWVLMNQKTGDDKATLLLDTKALSEVAYEAILSFLDTQPPSPSLSRIRFILVFLTSAGLRSSEFVQARLGDLQNEDAAWLLQVHGKGAKNRLVVIPNRAMGALREYLLTRGLGEVETAPPTAPLLASTRDPMEHIGYQSLYEHVKRWVAKAIASCALPSSERAKLSGATTHWLRHTFGTRAVARDVPLDVIQAQLGHASIQTTMNIYGRAPIRRRVNEVGKAFA